VPSPDAHPDYPGGVELHYPTGPLQLKAPDNTGDCGRFVSDEMLEQKECDLDTWAWGTGDFRQSEEISGLSESVAYMLDYILTYGPFVGVVGFSCGATLAAILASLLEGGRDIDGFSFPANVSSSCSPPSLIQKTEELTFQSFPIHLFDLLYVTAASCSSHLIINPATNQRFVLQVFI
jgi:hypothetical protein